MSCDRYRDALTDAAAGGPTGPTLAAHLESCAACRSELDGLRRLMAAADDELSALATAEPSPALRARIREAVVDAGPAPAWHRSFAWTATAAAVLAVAAFGVWRGAAGRSPVGSAVARITPAPAVAEHERGGAVPPTTGGATAAAGAEAGSPTPLPPLLAEVAAPAAGSAPAAVGSSLPAPSPTGRASPARPLKGHTARRAEPEVLVAAGGQELLLLYVGLVHREALAAPALSAAGEPSAELAELSPINVRPLEIVPLDPASESGT